uniref:Uncharacterized protein n=1 Tax=Romanomermis culicivorax TaxID=13658 RepID=A0A915IVS6_ROMCU
MIRDHGKDSNVPNRVDNEKIHHAYLLHIKSMANLRHFFLFYVLLYRKIGDAQVIIAKHDNCRHDLYKNDDPLKNSNSISTSQDEIFENFDSKSLVEKWCHLRALSGESLSKCTNSLAILCGDGNQTTKSLNESCPFLMRAKRQTDGKTEKASKEDLAKLKQGFAKLATDFFANLLKNSGKPGSQMGDVPMMSDTPKYSGAVSNNELQQNNPDNYLSGDMDVSKNQANHFFDILQQGAVALFSNAINKWASSPADI